MISVFKYLASFIAILDLPTAVGPAITINRGVSL